MVFVVIWAIIVSVIILLISSIPLHVIVRVFGGRTSLAWAAITNIIVGVTGGIAYAAIGKYAAIPAFIVLLVVYKFMFSLGWTRAFLAWLFQGILGFLIYLAFLLLILPLF